MHLASFFSDDVNVVFESHGHCRRGEYMWYMNMRIN